MKMRVMIDGKEFPVQDDVRILFEEMDLTEDYNEPAGTDLHLIVRHEGVTVDLVGPATGDERPIVGSAWRTIEDLLDLTTGETE